ncbi:hypothetical protein EV127DRAFT_465802 [Xylaria flabelliformis]|nr:hypothetical protein EV127DRAFT_465802 [Xylaria flabelliformis]
MAREKISRCASPSPSESHAQLLYHSLDQYNRVNKGRRWSSITLAALVVLFLSSASGIALAIALMVKVADIGAASLPRDVILFAATISMLYICLHVRGALKDYKREGTGPPQLYGQYLHASALLVARLSIFCWAAALISTAIMIARALPVEGFLVKLPYLDLLICIGAIPSCLIISVTIEKNRAPFATATISNPSLLTCRVSEYGDDIVSDMSVSRRTSLQHKKSKKSDAGSILTVPTEEIFCLGDAARYEEAMNKHKQPKSVVEDGSEGVEDPPTQEGDDALPISNPIVPSDTPPTLKVSDPTPDPAVPEPVYCPGGWRTEWNNAAQEVGVPGLPRVTEGSADGPARSPPSHLQHTPEVILSPSVPPSSQGAQSPTPSNASVSTVSTSRSWRRSSQRPVTASTSIASSAARSNLSTVRYASEPEIAVRQAIRVVPNPAYQPPEERQKPLGSRPEPVTLLRNAQRAQKTGPVTRESMRKPSNFSRPMQKTDTQGETESGAEKRTLCACVEDEKGETT